MISGDAFIEMALSFPGTEQKPHFHRIGIKVIGRRMYATYLTENNTANIFLSPDEQKIFCALNGEDIYPVPNKWGEKGATTFELRRVPKEVLMEALHSAYNDIVKQKEKRSDDVNI